MWIKEDMCDTKSERSWSVDHEIHKRLNKLKKNDLVELCLLERKKKSLQIIQIEKNFSLKIFPFTFLLGIFRYCFIIQNVNNE